MINIYKIMQRIMMICLNNQVKIMLMIKIIDKTKLIYLMINKGKAFPVVIYKINNVKMNN